MDASKLIQGGDDWKAARIGSVGGSRVAGVFSRPRAGSTVSKVREALLADLLAERLTGNPSVREFGDTSAIEWGKQTEPFARAAYTARTGLRIELAGLIRHPTVPYSHSSPDGLVGDDGMVEIKCPNTKTHLETVRLGRVPSSYRQQMLWGIACTGRKWCDFVSFDPRAEEQQLYFSRVKPTPMEIQQMEAGVFAFVLELEGRLAAYLDEQEVRYAQEV
jgi:putative phage-type endonuclease